MKEMRVTERYEVSGEAYQRITTVQGTSVLSLQVTVPAAQSGSLTTRTDNTDGTITKAAHGLSTGSIVDLYWTVAGVKGYRRNVTVGTVASGTFPISGGTGDNLPVANTAIVFMNPVVTNNADVVGDNVVGIAAKTTGTLAWQMTMFDSTTIELSHANGVGDPYLWFAASGITNPIATETISTIALSHAELSAKVVNIDIIMN